MRERMKPVLFYDGDCGLCAKLVQWTLKRDRLGLVLFSPLQGETYRERVSSTIPADLNSMVLIDDEGIHTRSSAAFKMLKYIGGFWGAMGRVGSILPTSLCNWGYLFVAKRRIGWFGVADHCEIPSPDHRARFLP